MATVSRELCAEIIAKHGYYSDDPRVSHVVVYSNQYGSKSFAICYSDVDRQRYGPSQYVHDSYTAWSARDGFSDRGRLEFKDVVLSQDSV